MPPMMPLLFTSSREPQMTSGTAMAVPVHTARVAAKAKRFILFSSRKFLVSGPRGLLSVEYRKWYEKDRKFWEEQVIKSCILARIGWLWASCLECGDECTDIWEADGAVAVEVCTCTACLEGGDECADIWEADGAVAVHVGWAWGDGDCEVTFDCIEE